MLIHVLREFHLLWSRVTSYTKVSSVGVQYLLLFIIWSICEESDKVNTILSGFQFALSGIQIIKVTSIRANSCSERVSSTMEQGNIIYKGVKCWSAKPSPYSHMKHKRWKWQGHWHLLSDEVFIIWYSNSENNMYYCYFMFWKIFTH